MLEPENSGTMPSIAEDRKSMNMQRPMHESDDEDFDDIVR